MPASTGTRPRNGGIRKHQRQRRDNDGDLIMGSAPRVAAAARPARGAHSGSSHKTTGTPTPGFTELKVTGWTDDKEMTKLINFLERHSSRRATNANKSHPPPRMIKRHRVTDTTLTIWVRPEDVTAFSKINGFTFTSAHGSLKLTITGPGIRSRSPNASSSMETADNKESGSEVKELLKGFLQRRYNQEAKLLSLSTIAEDGEVAKSGMFNSAVTQAKFFPALMIICDQTLKTTGQDKKDIIQSVTLSGNNLTSVDIVKSLATTLPHIRNLDLSGNNFTDTKDLKTFKNRFRFLEHLIVEIAKPGWEEEIISWFPKLRILNGVQVRPDPAATDSTTNSTAATPATANGTTTAAAPAAPASGLTQEQEGMIAYVQKETNLKRELAQQCLAAANWDLNAAAALFLAQKEHLSADSFIN
ncbi:hypothetical protein P280DRAFT_473263 [Massarina eburnea CBS 473.64]|uniref:TAP-C domain-containing protein n=1 Tax=Massarina eburnea CBS 473.64 TaxID=1395130 RepID=A0A6A6RNM2_9PLEO|nr:hypothetical protein P280DRAFT_473263 [Massarina eburnea CBS 473.64]